MTDEKLLRAYERQGQIYDERNQYVALANNIATRARSELNLPELRLLRYVISKVQPDDGPDKDYEVDIRTFLLVCGMSSRSGANYAAVKRQIENLWLKHFWIRDANGREQGVQWIVSPVIDPAGGKISVKLDPSIHKYVLGLVRAGSFFMYRLLYILPMRSEYSLRLYEFFKAECYGKRKCLVDVAELRRVLHCVDIYPNFKDFRRRVLDTARAEINSYTDLNIGFEPVFTGRRVTVVEFTLRQRGAVTMDGIMDADTAVLDAQMNIYDYL